MGGFPRQHIESVKMAPANTGAKKQKKKWSKGKVKDKAQHAVILDKATSDKLYKDVQSYRLISRHPRRQTKDQRIARAEMFGGFGGEGTDQEDCRTQQVADLHSCGRCCGIED